MPPPPSLENLAVHPKKILQVKDHLRSMMNQNSPKILILTGMSGSGKTACLRAAATELDFSINEWIEPVVINSMGTFSQSTTSQFIDFISSAAFPESQLLFTNSSQSKQKRILLIEDLPLINTYTKRPIHEALINYLNSKKASPIVLIVSDMHSNVNSNDTPVSLRQICPPTVLNSKSTHVIKFNPVSKTLLIKMLTRLDSKSKYLIRRSKLELSLIADQSAGDLRCAINALEFGSLKSNSQSIGVRDAEANLFSSLGKVLYNKRNDFTETAETMLANHLKYHKRLSMSFNPEVENC